jgi:CPA2 family monovalent cation:H+ antiporter-2
MLAILILQDISVVFMALAIPIISGNTENVVIAMLVSLGKVLAFIAVTYVLGRWVLPWLLGGVGGFRSRELFLLTVLVLCLGAAVSTQIFGLSIVFGTFLIGLVLRQTKFVHQALAEITPLKDIFTSLFFVSLGMLLDPVFIMYNWASVLVTIAFILIIKTAIIYAIARIFGYSNKIGLLTGLGLFQLGEFGFILAKGGMDNGMVSEYFYSLMLASSVTTMILTPLILSLTMTALKRITEVQLKKAIEATAKQTDEKSVLSTTEVKNRIIIAGYGEVGQNIAESLKEAGIPFLIIDDDPIRISQAKFEGHPRIFGDATNLHVLTQADIKRSKILVVTYPDLQTVISTINLARQINPEIIILTRAGHTNDKDELNRLGVKSVIVPEWEASYTFAKTLLKMSDIETQERSRVLTMLRKKA